MFPLRVEVRVTSYMTWAGRAKMSSASRVCSIRHFKTYFYADIIHYVGLGAFLL